MEEEQRRVRTTPSDFRQTGGAFGSAREAPTWFSGLSHESINQSKIHKKKMSDNP